jgi:serine/threonine-protein kinase RsbW
MSALESNLHRLRGPDSVHLAVMMVHEFCAAHALQPDCRARLAIVVEELMMNLVDHGGLGTDDVVEIGLQREHEAVHMLMIDHGTPFDPRRAAGDAPIPDRGGGAGLAFVNAWTEIVDYRTSDGANRLELRLPA